MSEQNKKLLTITWSLEDISHALEEAGIEPTEKNIASLLEPEHGLLKNLEADSIELGWCRMAGVISSIFKVQ